MLNLFQHPFSHHKQAVQNTKQPCVYILASQPYGTIYIGVTSDLFGRLHHHRNGTFGGFSKRYSELGLVRFEMFDDIGPAIAREEQLKNWPRQQKIKLIESENPDWVDLAVNLGLPPLPA